MKISKAFIKDLEQAKGENTYLRSVEEAALQLKLEVGKQTRDSLVKGLSQIDADGIVEAWGKLASVLSKKATPHD